MILANKIQPDEIVEIVSHISSVSIEDITVNKIRKQKVTDARQLCYYLIKKHTNLSYPEMSTILNKDHSTIIYGIKQIKNKFIYSDYKKSLEKINELIVGLKEDPIEKLSQELNNIRNNKKQKQ